MYQYSTTNIINSNLDSNGTTAKYAGSSTALTIARVGKFLPANIVSITKRAYTAPVLEIAQVTIPTFTLGNVARVEIEVGLTMNTHSEYASTYLDFKKPVYVEVIATGKASDDATALKNAINTLKDRYGFSYVTATTNSADLIITATDSTQRIKSIKVYEEAGYTSNSLVEPLYTDVTNSTFSVTTPGVSGFGTDAWMISHITIPTIENTRYFGISKDERPILGGNYTEYVLRYSIEKDDDGIVSGQRSITTHVFYVKSDLVAGFEAAIIATSTNIDTIGSTVTDLAISSATCDLSNYAEGGLTYTYTSTPSGVTGGVWSRDTTLDVDQGGSDAVFSKVTITPAGVLTLATGHGLVATDTFGLKCTCDGFTKSFTITVQD